jgi:hypothetical protein
MGSSIARSIYKPRSVPLRVVIIYLGWRLLATSSDLPEAHNGTGRPWPLLGLAPGGVCLAAGVTTDAGALLPHRFTLARCRALCFSVALCRRVAPPGG